MSAPSEPNRAGTPDWLPRSRGEWAALVLIGAAYGVTRLWRLTALPMFFDEAIHLLWAARWAGTQGGLKALEDGKLLQILASAASLRVLPDADPLWAGRAATVAVGLAGLAAAFALGRRVAGAAGGLLAASLSVACPFLLFHDRMALADAFVSANVALSLVATIALCDRPSVWRGAALGLALALAVASKAIALVVAPLPVAGVLLLARRDPRAWRALLVAFAVAGALTAFPLAVFLSRTGQIEEKLALEGLGGHVTLLAENLATVTAWLRSYWTLPVAALGLAGTLLALARRQTVAVFLVVAWSLPLGLLATVCGTWFPRYVLFTTVPFLALAASALAAAGRLAGSRGRVVVPACGCALVLLPSIAFDRRLLTDPSRAPFPPVDRWQYVESWPSGYGWRESAALLRRELDRGPGETRIVVERAHWTLQASFIGEPRALVKSFDLEAPDWPERAVRWLQGGPGWLVTSGPRPAGAEASGLRLDRVAAYGKPGGGGTITVYRIEAAGGDRP